MTKDSVIPGSTRDPFVHGCTDCETVKCELFLSSVVVPWIADQVRNDREKMKSFQGVE